MASHTDRAVQEKNEFHRIRRIYSRSFPTLCAQCKHFRWWTLASRDFQFMGDPVSYVKICSVLERIPSFHLVSQSHVGGCLFCLLETCSPQLNVNTRGAVSFWKYFDLVLTMNNLASFKYFFFVHATHRDYSKQSYQMEFILIYHYIYIITMDLMKTNWRI